MKILNHTTSLHLTQYKFPFGERQLHLDENAVLTIKEDSLFRKDCTKIPLELLQSSPAKSQTFSIKWLINSLILFILSGLVYWFTENFGVPYLHALTSLLGIFSLYAIYQFFVHTTDLVIYRNAYTNEHYLYLWNNNPNAAEFQEFIQQLNLRIDRFECDSAASPAKKLELYSQHIAFLHQENILDDNELSELSKKVYEKALTQQAS
jgi:hypothetical protein